jgi:hypothetical protein
LEPARPLDAALIPALYLHVERACGESTFEMQTKKANRRKPENQKTKKTRKPENQKTRNQKPETRRKSLTRIAND